MADWRVERRRGGGGRCVIAATMPLSDGGAQSMQLGYSPSCIDVFMVAQECFAIN